MSPETPIIDRAFEIARTGHFADTMAVRVELSRAGYAGPDLKQITPELSLEIKRLCVEAGGGAASAPPRR